MASSLVSFFRVSLVLACGALPSVAFAFGPDGHRIAGLLAEPRLCASARAEVAALAGGETLAELGVWADTVRDERRESSPWHYMNIRDPRPGEDAFAAARAAIAEFRDPPEGDVLEAIARFRTELADRARPAARRLDALRFVVHFVVDVHQPLHVGRTEDRGGNMVDVRYGDTIVNLHRFWDTDVIELRNLSPRRYARALAPRVDAVVAGGSPPDWAAESLALRTTVYRFGPARAAGAVALDADYVARAQQVTDERLVLAGARLAVTLNGVFCPR